MSLLNEHGRPLATSDMVSPVSRYSIMGDLLVKSVERDFKMLREVFPSMIYGPDGKPQPSTKPVTVTSTKNIRIPLALLSDAR